MIIIIVAKVIGNSILIYITYVKTKKMKCWPLEEMHLLTQTKTAEKLIATKKRNDWNILKEIRGGTRDGIALIQ